MMDDEGKTRAGEKTSSLLQIIDISSQKNSLVCLFVMRL
jgi:hypothetical protein